MRPRFVLASPRPALLALPFLFTTIPAAQASSVAAHFAGIETAVAGCTSECFGVAVDATGNVYIADTYNNQVLKESPSAAGYSQSVVGIGFNIPYGVAVDRNGNVYVADTYNNQIVMESLAAGVYTPRVIASTPNPWNVAVDNSGNVYTASGSAGTSNPPQIVKWTPSSGSTYVSNVIANAASGLNIPWEVAVDSSGKVYVTDSGTKSVYVETPSGSSYVQSTVATGFSFPSGLTVDSHGIVYVADPYQSQIFMESPASGGGYTQSVFATGSLRFPYELAADTQGNLYIANPQAFDVLKESPGAGDFGGVDIRSLGSALNLIFAFDSPGAIGIPSVVTQGVKGLDFADTGNGSCTTNGTSVSYAAGQTCVLQVAFQPTLSGSRYGAGMLTDGAGNVIATGYVRGTGIAPQLSFSPGTQISIANASLAGPTGVAVDAAGNVFIADSKHDRVVKETPSAGAYTETTVATTTPNSPSKVALDGSGSIYIYTGAAVLKETPSTHGYLESTVKTSNYLAGLAVDGSGNVYLTDYSTSDILKETPTSSGYVESIVPSSGLTDPFEVAVDGSGNVYVADANHLRIVKETLSAGAYTQTEITATGLTNNAQYLAVDPFGNVYISDFGAKSVLKETYKAGSYVQSTIPFSGLSYNAGVAIDGNGNVYLADSGNNRVLKQDLSDPPGLSFAITQSSKTSFDSPQIVTLENIGTGPLSFAIPFSGKNPSISQDFALDENATGACLVVDFSSSTPAMLAAHESCDLAVSFTPTSVGPITGSIILFDDNLNGLPPGAGTQTIQLSGTGTAALIVPTINWGAPAAILSGTALSATQLNATATYNGNIVPGTFAYNPAPGTVLPAGNETLSVTFTPTNTTGYSSATATVSIAVQDFSLPASVPTLTIASPGGSQTATIATTPIAGWTGTVALTCSVPASMAEASCSATSAQITGTAAANSTLTVTTTAPHQMSLIKTSSGGAPTALATLFVGILWFGIARRRRNPFMLFLWLIVFFSPVLLLSSCGGSSGGGTTHTDQGTPAGTYSVTLTATSGTLSHSIQIGVGVQ